jgi:predicted pyridoxine 5'-phosphate oxidase superfamily flavin-nucleotide-binding protein
LAVHDCPAVALATASLEGKPNVVAIWNKMMVWKKIIIIDVYMWVTSKNILHNNSVCLAIRKDTDGYKIQGTASYISNENLPNEAVAWVGNIQKQIPWAKCICITIDAIYALTPIQWKAWNKLY